MNFLKKVKGFLLEPFTTFNACKKDTLRDAIIYYIGIEMLYTFFLAIIFLTISFLAILSGYSGIKTEGYEGLKGGIFGIVISSIFIVLFLVIVPILINIFISGLITQIGINILGGGKEFTQTIKAIVYGSTPGLLFGGNLFGAGLGYLIDRTMPEPYVFTELNIWVIILIIVFWIIWSTDNVIIGFQQLHEITQKRAIVAGITWLITFSILSYFSYLVFWSTQYD